MAEPDIGSKERDYMNEAFDSGWISSKGPFISRFEDEFAKFTGTKYGVSCSNGTTALHLAVREFADTAFKEIDMDLEWIGSGMKKVELSEGMTRVKVSREFYRP